MIKVTPAVSDHGTEDRVYIDPREDTFMRLLAIFQIVRDIGMKASFSMIHTPVEWHSDLQPKRWDIDLTGEPEEIAKAIRDLNDDIQKRRAFASQVVMFLSSPPNQKFSDDDLALLVLRAPVGFFT